MFLTPYQRYAVILALVLTGLLAACSSSSSPDVREFSAQGLKNFQAAPLTKQGSESFFGQLAKDQDLIRPLITAFEARPRQTYLRVIDLSAKQKDRFVALEVEAVNVLVDSLVNVLETTEEAHSGIGPVDPPDLVWYYVDCFGNILTADYNEIFEIQGYFLSQDPPPSLDDIAKALNGDC